MTLLEAIKEAEKIQKELASKKLASKCVKIYIYRKEWSILVDPVNFTRIHGYWDKKPFTPYETSGEFYPNKNDVISNDWELFKHYYPTKSKENNKEAKPDSTTITRDNVTNVISQIAKAKFCLNSLNEHVKDIKTVFEATYGISFDCFKRNRNILIDKETNILYLFAIIASSYSKEINDCLSKIETELDSLNGGKKTE